MCIAEQPDPAGPALVPLGMVEGPLLLLPKKYYMSIFISHGASVIPIISSPIISHMTKVLLTIHTLN